MCALKCIRIKLKLELYLISLHNACDRADLVGIGEAKPSSLFIGSFNGIM